MSHSGLIISRHLLIMFMARHLIVFLLLVFSGICFTSADVSIDCGSSDVIYSDDNSISWSGDADYVSNGDSQVVQTGNAISHVMDTLRVFTSRKKNCYTVPADQGGRVYARASFYYGNYDRKSSPPSFDLLFDGNYWGSVQTMTSSVVYYEVVYVVQGDSTSICVAQTKPGQFPFMSALEVRSLDSTMYNKLDDDRALFLIRRVAFSTNKTIRFPDDLYDRIWTPGPGGNGLIAVTTDSPAITSSRDDDPPEAVLQNAITTSDVSVSIRLGNVLPTTVKVPVYMNLYFSEVTELNSTQSRSFSLFKDNTSISKPIVPPFGNFVEIHVSDDAVNSATEFYLQADSGSTLPPLINAMEMFIVSDPLTNGTNRDDVEGLALLQNTFDVLQEWSGDPCLPAPYSWDWVNCSSDATPRITALYLSSFGLSGLLPDISSMSSLQTIDLHNNSLFGPIPDSLGSLSNLKQLNLADNQFSGSIPASLSKKNNLDLVVTGNPDLCTSGKSCKSTVPAGSSGNPATAGSSGSKKKSSSKLPLILGITIPIVVLFWAVAAVFAILHYKRKTAAVTAVNAGGQNSGTANGNNNGINAEAAGKVGQTLFNAYMKNENNSSDNATSNSNNNETA